MSGCAAILVSVRSNSPCGWIADYHHCSWFLWAYAVFGPYMPAFIAHRGLDLRSV